MRNAFKILVRKSEGKRSLGRPRHRWKDNIKINIKEIWREIMGWIQLIQAGEQWHVLQVP
jgi:hypothetical protein